MRAMCDTLLPTVDIAFYYYIIKYKRLQVRHIRISLIPMWRFYMENIIYYFSGTGNSLRTAIKIAEVIGGTEIVSARCAPESVSAESAAVIGFICPVYEWDMPGTMKDFVSLLKINPNAYVFMIATYFAIHGKCFETMESLLSKQGAHLNYGYAMRCVASQCTAYPPFPPEKIMLPHMEKQIKKISKDISARKNRAYPHMSPITRKLYPKLMTPYMEVEHEYDKGFYTNDRCIGCATCAKVCPTKNIVMEGNHPVWISNISTHKQDIKRDSPYLIT